VNLQQDHCHIAEESHTEEVMSQNPGLSSGCWVSLPRAWWITQRMLPIHKMVVHKHHTVRSVLEERECAGTRTKAHCDRRTVSWLCSA
jgi:hypothetical protein